MTWYVLDFGFLMDRQIAGIRQILAGDRRGQARRVPTTRRAKAREPMSVVARKVISHRMKAYWAKRRQASAGKTAEEK